MPPYPRKKDLPPQNNLLTPVTGAAGQVVSYTPFMLHVCQQLKKQEETREAGLKHNAMDGSCEEEQCDSYSFGIDVINKWENMDKVELNRFSEAANIERVRRRLQRIYAESWVESAKQTRESNLHTPLDVMMRLREMDQDSKPVNRLKNNANNRSKSNPGKKLKEVNKKKSSPRNKRKCSPEEMLKPKNPVTAFQYYTREIRNKIRAENPGINVVDLAKLIGVRWKNTSTEDRAPYIGKQRADKVRFTKELEVYLSKYPEFSERYEKKRKKKTPNDKVEKSKKHKLKQGAGKRLISDNASVAHNEVAADPIASNNRKSPSKTDPVINQTKILEASDKGTSIFLASTQPS